MSASAIRRAAIIITVTHEYSLTYILQVYCVWMVCGIYSVTRITSTVRSLTFNNFRCQIGLSQVNTLRLSENKQIIN